MQGFKSNQNGHKSKGSSGVLRLAIWQAAHLNETQRLSTLLQHKSLRLRSLKACDPHSLPAEEAMRLNTERQMLEEDLSVAFGYQLHTEGLEEAYSYSLEQLRLHFEQSHQQQQQEIEKLKEEVNFYHRAYLAEAESHRLTLELWEKYCGGN